MEVTKVEKLNVNKFRIEQDDNLIQQMKEMYYACPAAVKFCREQGMDDKIVEDNIAKIFDFVRDINYCRKCPGIKHCKKDNPYLITKVTCSYGAVETQLIPCRELLKRVSFERHFLVQDFPNEWLDSTFDDIVKTKEKTEAFATYMKYLRNEETNWIYLSGGIGAGKSYFAAIMAIDCAKRNIKGKYPVCFINASKRILELSDLQKQKSEEFKKKLELYSNVPILVIDDFGHEFKNDFTRDAIVNEIISSRCNKRLFTIITSNFSLEEIEVLYSTSNAGAIMAKQICKTIKSMCKKEIDLGDLKLY